MAGPDTTAIAALAGDIRPAFFCWLDIDGDPVRVTTWGSDVTFSGTGDDDLDGYTFEAIDPRLVEVGELREQEGGQETLTATLSGIIGPDSDLLNLLGDPASWRLRTARLWQAVRNMGGVQQGAVWPYYTGRMTSFIIDGDDATQTVSLSIESYLAALSAPSRRTYLDAAQFDAGDQSARAAIAIANGTSQAGGTAGLTSGGSSGLLNFVINQTKVNAV
ncbi:hypothetical protein ABC347_07750 [Sphingomonas sp. 1P06PA]|uniref:hypothetical protein n=1 Tax=Sphingomonas sp. 1P06PA TaxID=554121 RepID=UPI0039A5CEE1